MEVLPEVNFYIKVKAILLWIGIQRIFTLSPLYQIISKISETNNPCRRLAYILKLQWSRTDGTGSCCGVGASQAQAFWLAMPLMFILSFSCHSGCVWWGRAVPVRDKLGMLGTGLKVWGWEGQRNELRQMLPDEESKVNIHAQLDKGHSLGHSTSCQEERLFSHTDQDLADKTTHNSWK